MLVLECSNIRKYFGDRLLLDIEDLKIYSGDKIGLIGINGVGKTTLMNILSQRIDPDGGWVKIHGKHSYILQLEDPQNKIISSELASRFGIPNTWDKNMSGGEKTRFKLAESLMGDNLIIFADEPTSNVDMKGIELIEQRFLEFQGALMVISHDRTLLDNICNKIMELENGKLKIYNGNYSDYKIQKKNEIERKKFEHEQYVKEKKRLEAVIDNTKDKIKGIKRPPKRMGNSEARLHKMGGQKAKATLDRAVKNLESRIEHLESKEKPKIQERIKFDLSGSNKLHSKIIIEGRKINKAFGEKIIFNDAEFNIYNDWHTALIGPNGCGKTTLIKMIMENEKGIRIAKGAKIGYFSQDLSILDPELTVLENVIQTSIYSQSFARLLLARLLFKGDDVNKKVDILSGGEKVKVTFAKMLLQDINLLILDEPTNYMDINSLEVMEEALNDYDRSILFVSHDREFVESVADHIMTIEDYKINIFEGNYGDYLENNNKPINDDNQEIKKQISIWQLRLSEIIGKLSIPSKDDDVSLLDREYHEILKKIKKLKDQLPEE